MADTPIGMSRFGRAALASHRVGFAGDSITELARNVTSTAKQWSNHGFVSWVRWLCGQGFYTDQSLIFAVGGTKLTHLRDTQVPAMIAAGVQVAVICDGINDIPDATTLADMIGIMDTSITTLNSAGVVVLLIPIGPTNTNGAAGTGMSGNAALQQKIVGFNHWLWLQAQRADRAVEFADTWEDMVDMTTGLAKAAYLNDGLHDNVLSASVRSGAVVAALSRLLSTFRRKLTSIFDTFDFTLAPQGNMLGSAGLFIGTGGAAANNATGVVATGWTGRKQTSAATTVTVDFSKGADAANPTHQTQIMTLGGTADGVTVELDKSLASVPAGIVAGAWIYEEAEVEWTGLSACTGLVLVQSFRDNAGVLLESSDGANATGKGNMPSTGRATLRTEPFQLPAGYPGGSSTAPRIQLQARSAASGSFAGVVTWKSAAIRLAARGATTPGL